MQKLAYPQLSVGLVGAWRPSAGATGFRLMDRSGRGNHGVLTNMDPATDWVASGGAGALDFDGVDDVVNLGSVVAPVWTFSAWVYRTRSTAVFQRILGQAGFNIEIATPSTSFLSCFDGSWRTLSSDAIPLNQWSFIAITYNGTSLQGTIGNTTYSAVTAGRGLTGLTAIGNLQGNSVPGNEWQGMLDDIRIYNRALAPAEIRLLATRRGIAYQRRKRRYAINSTPSFLAAWARGSNVLIQPGVA